MAFCAMCATGTSRRDARKASCSERRRFLQVAGLSAAGAGLALVLGLQVEAQAAPKSLDLPATRGLDEPNDPKLPPYKNIGPGVAAQEVNIGQGEEVQDGRRVSVKYVIRRSNGYFVDASYGFDRFDTFNFRAGSGDVVTGFDVGVKGMREGGRRRFIVKPEVGYVKGTGRNDPGPIPPDWGNRRALATHAREPLIFEAHVQL
eukprot:CAMPEP_0198726716 /NCGR_PEP_ID=MMETSP1475-20131203/3680_1 /TAXON_ID= ORGANISM="Unidentified sp., Strain CCMP1999" /NCGR_SAMPLE_ID=MMETSP1475 /ASSEMBLY_ACC=CAM_ASM_001111 /LENGTH=202 /DNA_ID=CAMNT_0044488671 /DNA_START=140 /DNA_END=748 /DNA_ORIENTATION=-